MEVPTPEEKVADGTEFALRPPGTTDGAGTLGITARGVVGPGAIGGAETLGLIWATHGIATGACGGAKGVTTGGPPNV